MVAPTNWTGKGAATVTYTWWWQPPLVYYIVIRDGGITFSTVRQADDVSLVTEGGDGR